MASSAKKYLTINEFNERLDRRLEQYASRKDLEQLVTKPDLLATRQELKDDLHRLTIRTEVLGNQMQGLTTSVAGIAEDLADLRGEHAGLTGDVAALRTDFKTLTKLVKDGQVALLSAINSLSKR